MLNHATLTIELRDGEDGYVIAECVDIPGCASQGNTREEALANVADAIAVSLEVITEDVASKLRSKGQPQPSSGCYKLSLATSELLPA